MKYVGIALLSLLGLFFAYILLLIVSALFVSRKKEYGTNNRYYRFLLNSSTAIGLPILGVKVILTGEEKIPKDKRFLLVSNHRSCYDPIVTWRALAKYDVAFISKASNFKVPVWGQLIKNCAFLPIDRSSPRRSMETLNKAAELIKNDVVSFGIYPEGTRSHTDEMLPFHNGIFVAAEKTKVPIVVMAVRNTDIIHKRVVFRRTKAYLDVIDVITPERYEGLRSSEIGNIVRRDLEDFFKEIKK